MDRSWAGRLAGRSSRSIEAAFIDACETVGRLLGVTTREDVRVRRQIGVILACVQREAPTYGERAVERMAESIGVSPHVLYQCARVAECWTSEELEELSTRTNDEGEPLTWSHFVTLTRSPSRIARREWTNRCMSASWSVRALRQAMATARAQEERVQGEADGGESAREVLHEGLRHAMRAVTDFEVTLEALRAESFAEGERDEELTTTVVRAYEAVASRVEATLECLREPLQSETRLRVAERVSPGVDDAPVLREHSLRRR